MNTTVNSQHETASIIRCLVSVFTCFLMAVLIGWNTLSTAVSATFLIYSGLFLCYIIHLAISYRGRREERILLLRQLIKSDYKNLLFLVCGFTVAFSIHNESAREFLSVIAFICGVMKLFFAAISKSRLI